MDAEIKEIKSNNIIQLEKDNDIKRFYINNNEGNCTGEYIEFNLQDIELPVKYQQIIEEDKKARTHLKFKLDEIERRPDKKGKKLMSANEEATIKAWQDFYKDEVRIYNMFLGEHGVEKILCGRKLSWNTLEAIDKVIENQILPELKISGENIKNQIMKKYSNKKESSDVLE